VSNCPLDCEAGPAECGNGTLEAGEVCDGEDLGGESCQSQGFDAGTLICSDDCQGFDTSQCTQGGSGCGDGACAGSTAGEDCHSCPTDCPGKTVGAPKKQYCCGNGDCEGEEDSASCPIDCG
jgi:hypothetical protein